MLFKPNFRGCGVLLGDPQLGLQLCNKRVVLLLGVDPPSGVCETHRHAPLERAPSGTPWLRYVDDERGNVKALYFPLAAPQPIDEIGGVPYIAPLPVWVILVAVAFLLVVFRLLLVPR